MKEVKKLLPLAKHKTNQCLCHLAIWFLLGVVGSISYAGNSVPLKLSATIEESCALDRAEGDPDAGSPTTTADDADLDEDGIIEVKFTIDCNVPFKYSLSSLNQALVNSGGKSAGSDTLLTQVNYKTTFTSALEDEGLGATSMTQECSSANLDNTTPTCNGNDFANSGTAVAIGKAASLKIAIDGTYGDGLLNGIPLLSGEFKDELKLTVSIQP